MPIKRGSSKKKQDDEGLTSLRFAALHPTCVIAEEDISELTDVGQGFYATVKFGHWSRPDKKKKENVAIKCIKEEMVRDHIAEILTEANNMVKLEHDNIIRLYGICLVTNENEPFAVKLVTEYARYGSLVAVIQDKDEEHHIYFCQIVKLWEFACQIAKGMEYLHSKNLIHFDLAARNVLVVAPNKVRISDFGLAKVLRHDKKILLEKPIAMAWCAPELFMDQLVTKGCDVWSYGVLLWEMMSFGQTPWMGLSNKQFMEQAENPNARLPQPRSCSNAIFDVMQECWKQEPGHRPTFTKISESLNKAKPVAASAKNNFWTVNQEELNFQKGTRITIIDRYPRARYLCQNDKAIVGYVSEDHINFKVAPVEITLRKPKISSPFDMRHTNKEAILKQHEATGVFPVEVENLVTLAEKFPTENIPVVQPKENASTSPADVVHADEIAGQVAYTSMHGGSQDVDESEPQTVKPHDPTKIYLVPPPIPKRADLAETPSSDSATLTRRKPVPKPRKNRTKSASVDTAEDSNLEWVIDIVSGEKGTEVLPSVQSEDENLQQWKDDMKKRNSYGSNGPELEMILNKTDTSAETKHNKQTNDDHLTDLIRFCEESQAVQEQEEPKPPPLPKRDIKPKGVHDVSFPSLPSPPAEIKTNDSAKELPANQREVKVDLLIDLGSDQDVENQKEKAATYGDEPPPLPQKDILSRKDNDLVTLPPPFAQTPRPMQGASLSSNLTHPSSYLNEYAPRLGSPVYSRPFPTTLQLLPKRNFPDIQTENTRPRTKSESSVEKETGYGDEINEGIAKIQAEFPDISKDACYAALLEYKGDVEQVIKVLQVCSLTSKTEKEAQFHLIHCAGDVQRTVNYILDNTPNV